MAKETNHMAKETYYMAKETYHMAKETYASLMHAKDGTYNMHRVHTACTQHIKTQK
jgi:hypothetical protein